MKGTAPRVVLASASPRRRELLGCIVREFRVVEPGIDEEAHFAPPLERGIQDVARAKCLAVAASCPDELVIAADTVVAVDGELLGKPADAEDAARMLRLLSGREHRVLTGVAVGLKELVQTGCETTRVVFDEISEEQIAAYVASGEPFDKAGAYGIQGRASVFVKGIEGCYFNVVGLPLHLLAKLLEGCGWPAWRLW